IVSVHLDSSRAARAGIMTHDEAFLEDIAEHPDDDAPRLIYADWLDDHGDPARAEFIRVQCELERTAEGEPRGEDVIRREQHLMDEPVQEWTAEVAPNVTGCWFRRGLLQLVSIEPRSFVEHAAKLFQHSPVTQVQLTQAQNRDDLPRFFNSPHLACVRTLSLSQCNLQDGDLQALAGCRRLPRLTTLWLGSNRITSDRLRILLASPFPRP